LYFIIAATILGSGIAPAAAFSYPLGIISIMKRIVVSLVFKIRDRASDPIELIYFLFLL
jgi:hypothetical protein